jgi:hypothetical protein
MLEAYLDELDKALGTISISDRADIILEIKSHVLDASNRDEKNSVASVLEALGEPQNVANRYLLERGLSPVKSARGPIMKWLVIGVLGSMGLFIIGVMILASFFTPLIKVDERAGHVKILGGLIDIQEKEVKMKVGKDSISITNETQQSDGEIVVGNEVKTVMVSFDNGEIDVKSSEDGKLNWSCKVSGQGHAIPAKEENETLILDYSGTKGVRCNLDLPAGIHLKLTGKNGKISLDEPGGPVEINLTNGEVGLGLDSRLAYRVETSITHGNVDDFPKSPKTEAIQVQINMVNGRIYEL